MIELDVQLTKDGHLVVIHDPTLERTTNGQGYIRHLTLEEIRQFTTKEGESIPTLDEVYALCKGKIEVLTEIKSVNCSQAIIELLNQHGNRDEVIIQSFLHTELLDFRRLDTRTRIATLFDEILLDGETVAEYLDKIGGQGAAIKISRVNEDLVRSMHETRKFVYACGATNEDFPSLEKLEVDVAIMTL